MEHQNINHPEENEALTEMVSEEKEQLAAVRHIVSEEEHEARAEAAIAREEMEAELGDVTRPIPEPVKFPVFPLNDMGMAHLFAKTYVGKAIWNQDTEKWHLWNGKQWLESGAKTYVRQLVSHMLKTYPAKVQSQMDKTEFARLERFVKIRCDARYISNIIFEARGMTGIIQPDAGFNQPDHLLNCENGILDLKAGKLLKHNSIEMLSQKAPCRYVAEADIKDDILQHYLWEASCHCKEWIDFLQLAAGYSLTGSVEEEVFFFISGEAATGKSTLHEAMLRASGNYGMQARFETFLESIRGDSSRQRDITRMVGKRLVVAEETDKKTKLATGMVKYITGNSSITARRLYEEGFEFDPHFTLWLASNYKPVVDHTDNALWRRMIHIPFGHKLRKAQMDPAVKHHLVRTQEGREAVFAWMVRGAMRWYRMRRETPGKMVMQLAIPEVISGATQVYRDEMNLLSPFLKDSGLLEYTKPIIKSSLFRRYEQFVKNDEGDTLDRRDFNRRMRESGFKEKSCFLEIGKTSKKKSYACWVKT